MDTVTIIPSVNYVKSATAATAQKQEHEMLIRTTANPDFGYFVMRSEDVVFGERFGRMKTKSCLFIAENKILKAILKMATEETSEGQVVGKSLEGRICVKEYCESDIPQEMKDLFYDKNKPEEEARERFIKRAGNDGPVLYHGEEAIYSFSFFDRSCTEQDILLAHSNVEDVRNHNEALRAKQKEVPAVAPSEAFKGAKKPALAAK